MSDTEVIQPEVVDGPAPGTAVVPAELAPGHDSALVAAAEAALSNPGAPGHDEFWALAAAARILCMSGAAPKAIRRDPHLALHVALVGRDLGISPSAALELIDIIEGKRGSGEYRLSLSPQLMNGQLRRLGIGMILPAERTAWRAEAVAFGPHGPDRRCTRTGVVAHVDGCECDVLGTSEFTWEDAQMAELAGRECQPGEHKRVTRQRSNGQGSYQTCGCNQGYITYPKRMLWWRAAGFAGDDFFPEAGLGLYSPEALGAHVDAHGRPLDVESVELPPGYEPAAVGQGSGGGGQAAPVELADPVALWELQELLHALPEGAKADLRVQWNHEDSRVRGFPPYALPKSKLAAAKAMVNAHWGRARGAGADRDTEVAALRQQLAEGVTFLFGCTSGPVSEPEAPAAAPEPEPGPDTPAEPAEPVSEPQGGADDDAEMKARWLAQAREVAEEARIAGEGVPAAVIERIAAEVKAMHHTAINAELAEAQCAESYPAHSPIDLRRMVVCILRLDLFKQSGVVPGGQAEGGDGAVD